METTVIANYRAAGAWKNRRTSPPGTTVMTAVLAYAAFECSPTLRQQGEAFIYNVESGDWRQHEALIALMARFDDELTDAFVIEAIDAMGLGDKTRSIARSAVSTLKTTSQKLARQIAPKFTEEVMRRISDHIKDVSLLLPDADSPRHFIGVRAAPELEALRAEVVRRIRAGEGPTLQGDFTRLLHGVVDLMLEEFYMKQIRLFGLGLVSRKLIDGGVAIGRGAQHQLIKWVVPSLDQAGLERMANYADRVTLHLEAHPEFRFFYHEPALAIV